MATELDDAQGLPKRYADTVAADGPPFTVRAGQGRLRIVSSCRFNDAKGAVPTLPLDTTTIIAG